jgi:hypothetical protein
MADHGKVDGAVLRQLEAQTARGVAEPRVDVVVQLTKGAPIQETVGDSAAGLNALEQQVRASQQGLLDHLRQLGAPGPTRQLTLTNAVVVQLTENQVRAVAERPDVRRLVLAEAQRVTT